jgi:hypothetical protein
MMSDMPEPSLDAFFSGVEKAISKEEPRFTQAYGMKNYHITILISNAPADTYTVIYDLHESYIPPQMSSTETPEFPIRLTSYGDYQVRAHMYGKESKMPSRKFGQLSDIIRKHYNLGDSNPKILEAIEYIEQN